MALGVFAAEVCVLTWQRYGADERISDETYKHRVATSFFSNGASYLGGCAGAGIGCLIGNLFCPGVGGYYGSMIGSLIGGAAASMTVEYFMGDKGPFKVEK